MAKSCVMLVLALVVGCGADADDPIVDEQPQETGTWCCYDDDAHSTMTCGLPEGRPLPAYCWDDSVPSHPGDG